MNPDVPFSSGPPRSVDGQEVPASLDEDLYCPHCGYNLRGLTSGRCPECGNACDLATMSRSEIPWLHRGRLGGVRAWWQTCWMALRRPGRMAGSINAVCPYAAARRFWLINVGVLCLPMAAGLVFFPITFTSGDLPLGALWPVSKAAQDAQVANLILPWASAMIYRPVAVLVCILSVMFATGGVSYLFQAMPIPRRQQDRAAAMALYASGALMAGFVVSVVLAQVGVLIWLVVLANSGLLFQAADGPVLASILSCIPLLTAVMWCVATWRLYRRLCHASLMRSVVVGILLCLTSVAGLLIAGGVIPWCIGMGRIIWLSFQA